MCGIVGFLPKTEQIDDTKFKTMLDTIKHRGPDDSGIEKVDGILFGHRRLSILDLSPDGHQPMWYKGRYVIVFNGEVYNYVELRDELLALGHTFKSKADTEVILASYDQWGRDCVSRFNGMFAFVIYDKEQKTMFCVRDRFGIKPFYFTNSNGYFAFASEIKALLPLFDKVESNNARVVDNILYGRFDHTNETMFKNIMQLRAGHCMYITPKNPNPKPYKYYDVYKIKRRKIKYEQSVKQFKDLMYDSVRLQFRSDVTVGSCLSGGLDSSSIVCVGADIGKQNNAKRQAVVSSCYKNESEKYYDEQEYIDAVVKHTGVISHKVFPSVTSLFDVMNDIIFHQDEPVGATALIPQYEVFRCAKEHGITVMLDGQGADEQLAGYTPFHSVAVYEYLRHLRFKSARNEIKAYNNQRGITEPQLGGITFASIFKGLVPTFLRKPLMRLLKRNKGGMIERYKWIKTPYSPKNVTKTFKYRSFDDYSKKSMEYGLVTLLHFEDRDSMAHSVEGRVPFLDHRLVEFVLSLPMKHKIYNGRTKCVLRDAMKDVLPEKIFSRVSKLGFAVPSDVWIMENPNMVRQELEKSLDVLGGLLDKDKIMDWFEKNKENKKALLDTIIWRIIFTGRWINIFNVKV